MLPKGITGYRSLDDTYIREQDPIDFKKLCYSIANSAKYKIDLFNFELTSKNFYYAKIKIKFEKLFILQNAYYPLIAFAKNLEYENIKFIDPIIEINNIHILTLEELNKNYYNYIDKLNKAEIEQINYWKPKTIGEIIFNFWD